MPNPVISVPKFPNVAQLPGVPQLIRANQAIGTVQLAVGAVQKFLRGASTVPQWGVFEAPSNPKVLTKSNIGTSVISPDNYLGFENSNDWKVSDFPLQDGQFSSYNKVIIPATISLKITKGGSQADRTALLAQLKTISGNTKKYNILTPEGAYLNFNVTRFAIRRMGREGAYYFADLEIFFRRIQEVPSQYSSTSANTANAQNPPATPPQNLGTQFPQAVPPKVQPLIVTVVANTPR